MLAQLRASGFDFEEKWFASHLEFRFPKIGSIAADGVELELRQALEPWNVLAEETASGRTVRTVDSSLERIQVKVSGLRDGFRATSWPAMDAGCRFIRPASRERRWRACGFAHGSCRPRCIRRFRCTRRLSSTLIDRWNERSIGRCTYHATIRPTVASIQARPVNADEAEARRLERFEVIDPASRLMTMPEEEINPIFPMTLDLRLPLQTETHGRRRRGLRHDCRISIKLRCAMAKRMTNCRPMA